MLDFIVACYLYSLWRGRLSLQLFVFNRGSAQLRNYFYYEIVLRFD